MIAFATTFDRKRHNEDFVEGARLARRLENLSFQGPVTEGEVEDLTAARELLGQFTLKGQREKTEAKPTPPGIQKHPITGNLISQFVVKAVVDPIGVIAGLAGAVASKTKDNASGGQYARAAAAPAPVVTAPVSSFADWAAPLSAKGSLGQPTLSFDAFEEKRAQKIAQELLARLDRQAKGVAAMIDGPARIDLTVAGNMTERERGRLEGSHLAGLVHQGGMGNLGDTGLVSKKAIDDFTKKRLDLRKDQALALMMG